ncbi:hypothetical protein Zmor_027371 [Zophobas morio]|uniref:Reverse transcriptase domain-containing protein n=1 Tax=Zophobas morio TaxID=2755281 RepID=A0AA38HN17_9CUCU|nr:hypothetical protein Zmor_027371 [Zophobas morio]
MFLTDLVPIIDIVLCRCILSNIRYLIAVVYIPPDVNCQDLEIFLNALEVLLINENVILIGDFNVPQFSKQGGAFCPKSSVLTDFCYVVKLTQCNSISNFYGNILDLLFVNNSGQFNIDHLIPALVPEDRHHPALFLTVTIPLTTKNSSFPSSNNCRYNFRRANFCRLYEDLCDINWSFLDSIDDVNLALDKFYDSLYLIINLHVPLTKQNKSNFPPWISSDIKHIIKTKNYHRHLWMRTRCPHHYQEFKKLRAVLKRQISESYNFYLAKIQEDVKSNPAALWRFLHQKKGTSRIPNQLVDDDNTEYAEPQKIVDAFASTFERAFSPVDSSPPQFSSCSMSSFSLSHVREEDLIPIMAKCSNNLTAGDDSIPSFMVRDCRFLLAKPLATIINLALRSGSFPGRWKRNRIIPVLKKDNPHLLSNYRPISILPNFAKVFEQVLYGCIDGNVHSYISENQHGFMTGRSTITNLAVLTQDLCESLDRRGQIDVIYTDFSRAFDTISHNILLVKLHRFGCSDTLLKLLSSYLTGRVNYVFYNGYTSSEFISTSGVPQGSNLGPLLFNVYLNDLFSLLRCSCLAYADDVKIYNNISSIVDTALLQSDLDKIVQYSSENKLFLNTKKCYYVTFTRKLQPIVTSYGIGLESLERKTSIKDLGVIFDSELTFNDHIKCVSSSASKSLGFIMRVSKYFNDIDLLKSLFFSFVMSKLEYASIIWYPIYLCQHMPLDRIHRKFLKYLSYKLDGFYPSRGCDMVILLQRHGLMSLSSRRDGQCANFIVKLINNRIDCASLLSKVEFNVPQFSSRHVVTFYVPSPRTNVLCRSPISVMCKCANKLVSDVFLG